MRIQIGSVGGMFKSLVSLAWVTLFLGIASAGAQDLSLQLPPQPGSGPTASSVLCFLLLGVLLGTGGQIARSAMGIKKEMDQVRLDQEKQDQHKQDPTKPVYAKWDGWFNMQQLLVSLLLGGASGAFACIVMWGETIDKKFLIACVAAGYAGSDFIEGFIQKYLPPVNSVPATPPQKPAPAPTPIPTPAPVAKAPDTAESPTREAVPKAA